MKTNLLKKYIGYTTFKITSFDLMYRFKRDFNPVGFELILGEWNSSRDTTLANFMKVENARKRIEWFQRIASKINIGGVELDRVGYRPYNVGIEAYPNPFYVKGKNVDQQESFDFLKVDIEKEQNIQQSGNQLPKNTRSKKNKWDESSNTSNQMNFFDSFEQSNQVEIQDIDSHDENASVVRLKKFFAISNGRKIQIRINEHMSSTLVEPIDYAYDNGIKIIQALALERQNVDFKYNVFDNVFNIFNFYFFKHNLEQMKERKSKRRKFTSHEQMLENEKKFYSSECASKYFEFETYTLSKLKKLIKEKLISKEKANLISKRIELIQKTFDTQKDTRRMLNTWNGIEMIKCPKGKFVSNPFGFEKIGHKPIISEIKNDFWLASTTLSIANVFGILNDSQDILSKYIFQSIKKHIYGEILQFDDDGIIDSDFSNKPHMLLSQNPFIVGEEIQALNTNAPFLIPLCLYPNKKIPIQNDYFCSFGSYYLMNKKSIDHEPNQIAFLMMVICNALSEKEGLDRYYNIDYTMEYDKFSRLLKDKCEALLKDGSEAAKDKYAFVSKIFVKKISINPNAKGYRMPTQKEWDYASTMGGSVYYNGTNDDLELKLYSYSLINDLYSNPQSREKLYTYARPQDIDDYNLDYERMKTWDQQYQKKRDYIKMIGGMKTNLPNDWGFYYMDGIYTEMCFDSQDTIEKEHTSIDIDTTKVYSPFLFKIQNQSIAPHYSNYVNEDVLEKIYRAMSMVENVKEYISEKNKDSLFERVKALEYWQNSHKIPNYTNEKKFMVIDLCFNDQDYEFVHSKFKIKKEQISQDKNELISLISFIMDEIVLRLCWKIECLISYIEKKRENITILYKTNTFEFLILKLAKKDEELNFKERQRKFEERQREFEEGLMDFVFYDSNVQPIKYLIDIGLFESFTKAYSYVFKKSDAKDFDHYKCLELIRHCWGMKNGMQNTTPKTIEKLRNIVLDLFEMVEVALFSFTNEDDDTYRLAIRLARNA